MISEVLSLTSTESPAYAAMALICFTARALKRASTFTEGESNVRAFPQLLKMYTKSHETCLCCAIYFVERGCSGKGEKKGEEETRATARD